MAPRASASQYGAPSPVKAGTTYTPPVSGTLRAMAHVSATSSMRPSSSRSHCKRAPAMNTLPSSAYSGPGAPGAEAASVVTSRWVERHASRPVCMSRKQPVPYVFFACPASKQHWPKSAACWSPATPRMGTPRTTPGFAVTP